MQELGLFVSSDNELKTHPNSHSVSNTRGPPKLFSASTGTRPRATAEGDYSNSLNTSGRSGWSPNTATAEWRSRVCDETKGDSHLADGGQRAVRCLPLCAVACFPEAAITL